MVVFFQAGLERLLLFDLPDLGFAQGMSLSSYVWTLLATPFLVGYVASNPDKVFAPCFSMKIWVSLYERLFFSTFLKSTNEQI